MHGIERQYLARPGEPSRTTKRIAIAMASLVPFCCGDKTEARFLPKAPRRSGTPEDPPGVTAAQVREALLELWGKAQENARFFPKTLLPEIRSAIIDVSISAGRFAPAGFPLFKRSLYTAPVGDGWRVDLDNLAGTNLRQ